VFKSKRRKRWHRVGIRWEECWEVERERERESKCKIVCGWFTRGEGGRESKTNVGEMEQRLCVENKKKKKKFKFQVILLGRWWSFDSNAKYECNPLNENTNANEWMRMGIGMGGNWMFKVNEWMNGTDRTRISLIILLFYYYSNYYTIYLLDVTYFTILLFYSIILILILLCILLITYYPNDSIIYIHIAFSPYSSLFPIQSITPWTCFLFLNIQLHAIDYTPYFKLHTSSYIRV
jgi:hypothetical protein